MCRHGRGGGRMSGMAERWQVALDAIERDLVAVQEAQDAGVEAPVTAWQAPAHLGPLPGPLRARAAELAARVEVARARCERGISTLRGELDQLDRRRDAGSAYAAAGQDDPTTGASSPS